MDIELVAEGLLFPEGPIAMADGSVILTEIQAAEAQPDHPDGKRRRWRRPAAVPTARPSVRTGRSMSQQWRQLPVHRHGRPQCARPTPPSHTGGSIQRVDIKTGAVTTLYTECDGKRWSAPMTWCSTSRRGFWFTDHGCSTPEGRKFGALYYALTDGSKITRQRDHFVSPNGVGLSPDEKTVYMADTTLGRLWSFDIAEPGVLARRPASRQAM
ncbi:SMP-30/gluconolactonase/LRE family protein [Caulobacter sp. B11]|uniref:SMP-30/gluconolactonase/LRE family protein n=1 Tax=Caulobacter sp. B11 TaxID=2048899 RepID=UPI002101AED3|nr:SMP-30/gluconolactonase/LRE family protein [Caulobacter sp. B11]